MVFERQRERILHAVIDSLTAWNGQSGGQAGARRLKLNAMQGSRDRVLKPSSAASPGAQRRTLDQRSWDLNKALESGIQSFQAATGLLHQPLTQTLVYLLKLPFHPHLSLVFGK